MNGKLDGRSLLLSENNYIYSEKQTTNFENVQVVYEQ